MGQLLFLICFLLVIGLLCFTAAGKSEGNRKELNGAGAFIWGVGVILTLLYSIAFVSREIGSETLPPRVTTQTAAPKVNVETSPPTTAQTSEEPHDR